MENNNKSPQSVISNEVEITGTIRSSGSVQIDGKLDGELHCGGDAVVGKTANIKGNLAVNSATIEGTIHGNVTAKVIKNSSGTFTALAKICHGNRVPSVCDPDPVSENTPMHNP